MALLARDGFNRTNTADIDGSSADGDDVPAAASGTWLQHPVYAGYTIGIADSHARPTTGTGSYAAYVLDGVAALDTAAHASELAIRFPTNDTTPTTTHPACSRFGRTAGLSSNPESGSSPPFYRVWFERPDDNTTVTIEADFANGNFLKGFLEVGNRYGVGKLYYTKSGSGPGDPATHKYAADVLLFDYCNFFEIGSTSSDLYVTANGSSVGGFDGGGPHAFSGSPSYAVTAGSITLADTDTVSTYGGSANEWVYTEALVRMDSTDETNYAFGVTFDHTGGSGSTPTTTLELWASVASSYTLLRSSSASTILHDEMHYVRLEATAGDHLIATLDGTVIFDFDLATDLADETSDLAPYVATGQPGMSMQAQGLDWEWCEQYSVYGGAPCEGTGDNPYPWDPPPDAAPTYRIWVRRYGAWREAEPPYPAVQTGTVSLRGRGGERLALDLQVRTRGKWRNLGAWDSEQNPFTPTDLPPFYDPCNLLPTQDPGTTTLDPLTGRFFGINGAPVSVTGDLFTGTVISLGSWTPADLLAAAALGVTLVTDQGGYTHYLSGGVWDRDAYIAEADSRLAPLYSTLSAATNYFGHSLFDDFDSRQLWPPSGIPHADMAYIVSYMHSTYSGLRFGCRGRPTQFTIDAGFDFYRCQYRSWGLGPAYPFGANEYGKLLTFAGTPYILLDLNYREGGNGSSGIQVSSGHYMCSPPEVVSYFSDMYLGAQAVDTNVPRLAASLGHRYDTTFLAQPGMASALGTVRNALAALPVLP